MIIKKLVMLKQDFIKEGYTEENAVNEAIKCFGNNSNFLQYEYDKIDGHPYHI